MYVCMYACMYACICMYVCIYVCMYVCMYVYVLVPFGNYVNFSGGKSELVNTLPLFFHSLLKIQKNGSYCHKHR